MMTFRYMIAIVILLANTVILCFGALTGRDWIAVIAAIGMIGGGLYLNRAS